MRRWSVAVLLLCGSALHAQGILLLDHRFSADSATRVPVTLKRNVVYRAELIGPGMPLFEPASRFNRHAFLVPVDTLHPTIRRFEVYALLDGPHTVSLTEMPAGTTTEFHLYQDSSQTRRIAERRDQTLALGLMLGMGYHDAFRLDSTGGSPRTGRTAEGCLLLETGSRFATCLGAGGERVPSAGYSITALFIEERLRIVTARFLGARATDLGATLRLSEAFNVGPQGIAPNLVSWGLYASQSLASSGTRKGLRVIAAWQHNSIGNARDAQPRHYNRFTGGLVWLP